METTSPPSSFAQAHVERAREREQARVAARSARREVAIRAANALRGRYGEGLVVHLFGSVLDADRFRLDSDIDLAVRGLPADRFYEAWETAEAAAGSALDLVGLEDAPGWLADVVRDHGEPLR